MPEVRKVVVISSDESEVGFSMFLNASVGMQGISSMDRGFV